MNKTTLSLGCLVALVACGEPSTNGGPLGQVGEVGGSPGSGAGPGSGNAAGSGATSQGGSSSAGNGGAGLVSQGGSSQGGTGGKMGAFTYPLTLTPLTSPQTSTANISLFFSLVDATGQPVTTFGNDDFVVREDGEPIAKNESDFQAAPLSGQTLDLRTVLVLDLSGSIVAGGALEKLKQAATAIVDAALPEQSIALMTFADQSKVRLPFTKDKNALKNALKAITDKDGLSTNLYGAVTDALVLWQDGFVGAGTTGKLTTGFALVITDGADTAGVKSLNEVIKSRGAKRVITVGVGSDVNVEALTTIGNAGYISSTSFDNLGKDITKVNNAAKALSQSIYRASYCSPKLAGQHTLLFYPEGNPAPSSGSTVSCKPPNYAGAENYTCKDAFDSPPIGCGITGSTFSCCPSTHPFACISTNKCYATAEIASENCGSSCIQCAPYTSEGGDNLGLAPGPYLQVKFNASGHSTSQCPAAWSTQCKALASCCSTLPDSLATQCSNQLVNYQGNESQCSDGKQQYCPVLGPQCLKAKECCATLPASEKAYCEQQVINYAASKNDAQCASFSQQQCPTYGPQCQALKDCCAKLPGGTSSEEPQSSNPQTSCLQAAKQYAASKQEEYCQIDKPYVCPTYSPQCQALQACCLQLSEPQKSYCQQNAYSYAQNMSNESCTSEKNNYCPGG